MEVEYQQKVYVSVVHVFSGVGMLVQMDVIMVVQVANMAVKVAEVAVCMGHINRSFWHEGHVSLSCQIIINITLISRGKKYDTIFKKINFFFK
jgi:hypothetical protein